MNDQDFLTAREVADEYEVSLTTVSNWVKWGLKCEIEKGGPRMPRRLFKPSDVKEFLGD